MNAPRNIPGVQLIEDKNSTGGCGRRRVLLFWEADNRTRRRVSPAICQGQPDRGGSAPVPPSLGGVHRYVYHSRSGFRASGVTLTSFCSVPSSAGPFTTNSGSLNCHQDVELPGTALHRTSLHVLIHLKARRLHWNVADLKFTKSPRLC